jgi:succinate dehydrogenase / fumarate reductase, cytochrome b subunit
MSISVKSQRPLSPHLSIYKPQLTSILSIMHRATGVALSIGTVLLALWFWSAAYSPDCFAWLTAQASGWFGRTLLLGWTAAFFYHLSNGIRHLLWDIGFGFTLPAVYRSGYTVLILTILMTGYIWCTALYS